MADERTPIDRSSSRAEGWKTKYVDSTLAELIKDCESKGRDPEKVAVKGAIFFQERN